MIGYINVKPTLSNKAKYNRDIYNYTHLADKTDVQF